MGLVEVEDVRVEQPAGRVELVGDAVGIGPQRLAGDEQLVPMGREVRAHHRLGRPVLRRDVEVVDAVAERQPEPVPGFLDGGGPAGRATEHGDAALVASPSEPAALHRDAPAIP